MYVCMCMTERRAHASQPTNRSINPTNRHPRLVLHQFSHKSIHASKAYPRLVLMSPRLVSPRRPAHLPPADDMEVQVIHGLRAVGPVVDDYAEATGGQPLLLRDVLRDVEEVAVRVCEAKKW